MPNPLLLLVDSDARSSRVLRVSLEQAGYEVVTAGDGEAALGELGKAPPAVVLTATALPKLDGYSLVRHMRQQQALQATPVVFFTDKTAIEDRIRGLELGVEHYLAKPIYVRELLSLVGSLVARSLLVRIEQGTAAVDGIVSSSLADLAMLDVLQSLERGRGTVRLRLIDGHRQSEILVRDGHVLDARFERLRGEEAVFRALVWPRGKIELWFEEVPAEATISRPTAKLIDAALGYISEWNEVVAQLPGLGVAMSIDLPALRQRVGEIPDQLQGVLQLLDGRHTLYDVMDESPFDDLSTLQTIGRLYQEGLATAVSVGGDAVDERIAARSQPGAPADGRRHTNPWLDDAESAGKALTPDSGAISKELVAAPLAKLGPATPDAPTRRATPGGRGVAGSGGREAPAALGPSDFDEKVAERAVDALVGPSAAVPGQPTPDKPVVIAAPKAPRPQASGPRTRMVASPTRVDRTKAEAPAPDAPPPVSTPSPPAAQEPAASELEEAPVPLTRPAEGVVKVERAEPIAPAAVADVKSDEASVAPARGEPSAPSAPAQDAATAPSGATGEVAGEAAPSTSDAASTDASAASPLGASAADGALAESGSALGVSSSGRRLGQSGSTLSSRGVKPPVKRKGREGARGGALESRGPSSVDSAVTSAGAAKTDEEPSSPESLRALGESGVSEAFLRSAPASGEPVVDEPPFSEPRPQPLSPEQQARRRRLMRVVGAVVGLAVAVMAFIYLRDPGGARTGKGAPAGSAVTTGARPTAPTASATAVATEPASSAAPSSTAAVDAGAPADAGPDAASDASTTDAGDAETLPDVPDPLGEVRKLANAGRYHDAIPMAKAAIKADPDNAEPYMYLAEAYRALGKHVEMQAAYDDCVARATKSVGMWCPYGKKK